MVTELMTLLMPGAGPPPTSIASRLPLLFIWGTTLLLKIVKRAVICGLKAVVNVSYPFVVPQ
jgi:hypothetical protein